MKSKYSKAKRTIISAISLLAVSSAFIAPAYYDTDVFCSITASAADTTSEEYFNFSDGVINGFSDKGKAANITKLVIPEKIGGAAVTSIGTDAFYGCDSLTEITIPSGVTSIGDTAFYECFSLTKITLPSGITSIGNGAFYNCYSLTKITLPSGITSIESRAFYGCDSLTEIKIPDNVASIGIYAFSDCKGLTEITIPSGVTSIESHAFYGCKNLESVKFLSDVPEKLDNGIFSECGGITLTVPQEYFTNWQKKAGTSHLHVYSAFFDANIIVVPDETESSGSTDDSIEEYFDFSDGVINGFSDKGKAANITKLVITEKIGGAAVTSIGTDAFYGCDSLTEITLPSGVTSIGDNAFHDCYSLTKIMLPSGITSIGNGAFCDCTSLTEITLPNGITSINNEVFSGCESLTEIKIPDNVASIGIYAFSDCKGLTEITIPSGVTSIESHAFYGCKNLESVKFLSDVPETLELGIFSECGGITLTVPQEYFTNWQKKTGTSHFHVYSAFFDANIVVVPDETESSGLMGDANCDNKVNMADVVLIMQSIANPDKYGITGSDPSHITSQGTANSDVTAEKDGLTNMDALVIQKYLLGVLKSLPETEA